MDRRAVEAESIFPADRFVRRMNQETMHLGAIRALEFRFLDPTELKFVEIFVISRRRGDHAARKSAILHLPGRK